ncbi:MAG: hypothetical protein FWE48_06675, partial [Coriobacteriia bacterium]|nr:hypothetical protein [Coriobacteriia bacterium]
LQGLRSQAANVQMRVSNLGRDVVNYGTEVSDLGREMSRWSATDVKEWGIFSLAFLMGAGLCERAALNTLNCPDLLDGFVSNRDPVTGAVLLSDDALLGASIIGTLALAVAKEADNPGLNRLGTVGGPLLSFGTAFAGNVVDGKTGFDLARATIVDGSIDVTFGKIGAAIGTKFFPGKGTVIGAGIGLGIKVSFSALVKTGNIPGTVVTSLRPPDISCHLQPVEIGSSQSSVFSSGNPNAQPLQSLPPSGAALSSAAIKPTAGQSLPPRISAVSAPVASLQHLGRQTTTTVSPLMKMHPEGGFRPIPQTGGAIRFD